MSEHPYSDIPQETLPKHAYAIIRNPREHVLSQYFHCTESGDHVNFRHLMPTLDNWLASWFIAFNNPSTAGELPLKFRCYNPTNFQSTYLGFDPEMGDNERSIQLKFTVIGPMDQMDKVLCVVFIHYAGWVPNCCKCSKLNDPPTNRRRLFSDHGVTHHGSTYNTTKKQDDVISWLVEKDNILYDHAKNIFDVQSKLIEKKFNFTLCNKIGDTSL